MTLNKPLAKNLRSQLENTVKAARDVAEKAAQAALTHIGVGESEAPSHLTEDQKALRRRLRAHGRQLGDIKHANDTQPIRHLVWEVAYEHWHRMLFARFLAENHLLMWEPGAAVTLAECEELAQDPSTNLGAKSGWELAAILAARMLPQVFKPHSPVFELRFSPNEQRDLELLLKGLPTETFHASDSLGWVYQFWQAKRKDEVNASEVKIGGDELSAVTQLFTEPYMVEFLLHNSLGAWWVTRHPEKPCPVELSYLRRLEDGTPVSGLFAEWPDSLAEFRLLDPCCGSGHFLVAAFLMLVPMRMVSEKISAKEAVQKVLIDNIFGLELDPRCVEIAVFAVALEAWRYQGEDRVPLGVREIPSPQIACCGLKVAAKSDDWQALVPIDSPNALHLRTGLSALHETFAQAPLLGSLLDPSKGNKGDLFAADYDTLTNLLGKALAIESSSLLRNDENWELALSAKGLLEASRLLQARYHLIITNVPYLTRGKQNDKLKDFCDTYYHNSKSDLANVFLDRCIELSLSKGVGVVQVVMPQNWLFLSSYKYQRERLLKTVHWSLLVKLGGGAEAFSNGPGNITNICMFTCVNGIAIDGIIRGIDVSEAITINGKVRLLREGDITSVSQKGQLVNPDARILMEEATCKTMLSEYAVGLQGISPADFAHYGRNFWEVHVDSSWHYWQSTIDTSTDFGGRELVLWWNKDLLDAVEAGQAYIRGKDAWGKRGVVIKQMDKLPCAIYTGEKFDTNCAVILPKDEKNLPAIFCYCSSPDYRLAVRKIDQKLNVTNATLVKVPFDLVHWSKVATEKYPLGLSKSYSGTPTQWIFHGHPRTSTDPLQVGIARLLGYTWPAESNKKMELSDEARTWIERCKDLSNDVDDDGIVCLRAVKGEKPAHERLLTLLINAWETVEPGSWKASVLDKLLADADSAGKGLDVWLQEKFFEQHAKLFQHRPFIWHVWDGLKDGFSALVNYHKLDTKNLERLIHTYLGDWIRTQEAEVTKGIDGAELRLAAAQALKKKLEAILEGEAPYDIFVRWKSLAEQPIGWTPDLNDGVRMNIRPFMTAEVLRHNKKPKLNITWDKDRGRDVISAPWYKMFNGERINDHHLTLAEKITARDKADK